MRTHTQSVFISSALLRVLCVCSCFCLSSALAQTPQHPWPIRAVIMTTFEIGKDTGDIPGEFQLWVEGEHLTESIDFPGGIHPILTNKEHTVLGLVSGTTLVNATASMMGLGLDQRFDLSHAYILINGIAGVDPQIASIGSAAWADYVLNDVSRYIDPKEAPTDWPYGFFPVTAKRPDPPSVGPAPWFASNLHTLNPKLAAWAYAQTKDLKLADDPAVTKFRAGFTGYPNAQRSPFVLIGDSFASDFFWHGKIMTQFARDWVRLYSGGKGVFAMTNMEDSGFMAAIERLAPMHRVDPNRVLVLRTGSNFSMQRPGDKPEDSLNDHHIGTGVAVKSAYLVGSTVLHKILANWDTTYATIPGN
jgi:purine nucleoside permease